MAWAHQGSSWTEAETNIFARVKWLRVLLMITPAVVALCAALWHGAFLVDDAYITFRYAENLAGGRGLVFNPGDAVLGTSSPLMAILLGLLRLVGVNVPLAARGLGVMSVVAVVLIVQVLARRCLGPVGAAVLAACAAIHPALTFTANSGMETGLSMAAVYGTLLLAVQGRYFPAGLAGGTAFLLRPDGALVVLVIIGVVLLRAPRRVWQPLVATVVVAAPWLIFAAITYGRIMPHSIEAKQFIHPDTPLHVLQTALQWLTVGRATMIIGGFAMVGLAMSVFRGTELALLAIWILLYLGGLSLARIECVFPWYVTPVLPGMMLLAGYGITCLARALPVGAPGAPTEHRFLSRVPVPFLLLLLAVLCLLDAPAWRAKHERQFARVRAYLRIAELLRPRCAPGDVVFLGEVGALAYGLAHQRILDSSGINSPEVLHARKADRAHLRAAGIVGPAREGSPVWVLAVVDRFRPRYIVTYRRWLHIETITEHVPSFNRTYRRIAADVPGLGNFFVFERVAENTDRLFPATNPSYATP